MDVLINYGSAGLFAQWHLCMLPLVARFHVDDDKLNKAFGYETPLPHNNENNNMGFL